MYDEVEHALGVDGGRRKSALLWFLAVFGLFAVVGITATGFAVRKAVNAVQERLAALDLDGAATRVVDRLDRHTALLRAEPSEGLAFLRSLDAAEPSRALLGGLIPADLAPSGRRPPDDGREVAPGRAADQERDADERRTFTLRAGEEELRIDFRRDDDGGSLEIGSGDERLRLDLVRTEDGGFLTIDDGEDEARVHLLRTEDGGRLTIDAPDGEVRFDLRERDGGGSLVVRTDRDEVLRLGLGEDARAMPRWVPRRRSMPATPEPVYSLTSDEGFLGAVTWEEATSSAEVVEFYASRLEDEGFRLESEAQDRGGSVERDALWARMPDSERFVFVLAQDDGAVTRVLLGFGEAR